MTQQRQILVSESVSSGCSTKGSWDAWHLISKEAGCSVRSECTCPLQVRWAGDRCSVCDSDVDFDTDQLVSCDACGLTVHQSCYGVAELPGVDDMWLCRACELKARPGTNPAYPTLSCLYPGLQIL